VVSKNRKSSLADTWKDLGKRKRVTVEEAKQDSGKKKSVAPAPKKGKKWIQQNFCLICGESEGDIISYV
jgi:hypothetical protein